MLTIIAEKNNLLSWCLYKEDIRKAKLYILPLLESSFNVDRRNIFNNFARIIKKQLFELYLS